MNLSFDQSLIQHYTSQSQIARVLTEAWVQHNGYCPNCCAPLHKLPNNQPVSDFSCLQCAEQFELKSKHATSIGTRINDGAYSTMIEKVRAQNNPNFFFLVYNKHNYSVRHFLIVPKHFFTESMIVRRTALPATARRAGWVGCNIDIKQLPEEGKIFIVQYGEVIPQEAVQKKWQNLLFLRRQSTALRGWTLALLRCLDQLPQQFTLKQVYQFTDKLQLEFPENHHIHDKIRQQLQILRDQGMVEFAGRGQYRKIM